MVTALATVRTALFDALAAVDDVAQLYRHRQDNYQYPAIIVGWPQAMDVRPAMGDPRDFVIDVHIAVEVIDPESSDDLLSELLEAAVAVLLDDPAWDVRPVTDFGEQPFGDGRVAIWCRLPVAVFA